MKINKSNSVTSAIVLLFFGIFLFFLLLGFSLFSHGASFVDLRFLGQSTVHLTFFEKAWQNCVLFVLLALPPVMCLERGLYELRRGVNIRKDEMDGNKSAWRFLAVYYKYADFLNNILFTLFFLALTAFEIFVLVRAQLTININTLMFFIGFMIYIILRKTLVKGIKKTTNKLRKGFPAYTLLENGIEMRLYPIGKSKFSVNPPHVTLDFDELNEVKVFNDVEADNYMKYTIGPDPELSKAMVSDKYRYLKGEIPRPSVFRSGTCANSKSVLFRGKNLFYLITYETDDVGIIEECFNRYTRQKQESLSPQA